MSKLHDLRQEILNQINAYFEKDMRIEERTLQVLEYSNRCPDGWMDSADIFLSSLEYMPSLTNLFIRSGIPAQAMSDIASSLKVITSIRKNIDVNPDIDRTIRYIFPKFDFINPPEYSRAFMRVRRKGVLSVLDIIIGQLLGDLEGYYGDGIENELTARLLEKVKLNDTYWDEENEQYMLNLSKRIRFLSKIDHNLDDQQFVVYWDLDKSKYHIRPFGTTGIYQLSSEPLKDGSLWIARGNVYQPVKRFSEEAFDELEFLINNDSTEYKFQKFFERNPEFLLALGGGKYCKLHPQVILHEDSGEKLIPDFLLEKVNDHMCDICDLKLATQEIKKFKLHRPGFKAAIHEAIAQLDYYRNWFEDREHRDNFYSRTGLLAYRPKVVLIVGRSLDYYTDIERIQRESLFPDYVELVTYDSVYERVKMYKSLVNI